jgi:protein TonB
VSAPAVAPEAAPPLAPPQPEARPVEPPPSPEPAARAARQAEPSKAAKPVPPRSARSEDRAATRSVELDGALDLKVIASPAPKDPPIAVQLREEGTVDLVVEIGADGVPKDVTLYKSSGFGSLDEEAVRTMRRWRFSPPTKSGHASAVTIYIPMVFKLKHHDGRGAP